MIEIRNDEDGKLDEIVAEGCDFHMEYMGDGRWWLGVTKGEHRVSVWFSDGRQRRMCVEDNTGAFLKVRR